MTGNRERLIAAGLFKPLSENEVYKRNGTLFQLSQGVAVAEKPIYCVYRRDETRRQVSGLGENECRDAELIADKLYSGEAWRLCNKLNSRDEAQPMTSNGEWYCHMYGICTMGDWTDWEMRQAQVALEGV